MLIAVLRAAVRTAIDGATRPVGIVLSGGVDSSTIARLAHEVDPTLPTFTGYYAEGPQYDERDYARLVAGTNHTEIEITPDDFVDHFDAMLDAAQPPYQGPGTFGQFMVARHIAAETPVGRVLSGEGGDELFGGYARLHIVAGIDPPDGYDRYTLPPGYPTTLEDALAWDLERLPDLLAVDDQMMAAAGLEAVAPMTDPRVFDYVLAQPARDRVGKTMLKNAMRGTVPDRILNRTDKRGFPAPYVAWAQREPVRTFVADRIGYVPDRGEPWARGWWLDLCTSRDRAAA